MVKVFAPGSIGNVGPGFDVLGLAVEGIGDIVTMEESSETSIEIFGRDAEIIPTDPKLNTVSIAAKALMDRYKVSKNISIKLDRSLPSSGGLGASAASSVAGALAAAAIIETAVDQADIIEAALVAETAVAGRHLDNIAPCVFGGLSIVQSDHPIKIYSVPVQLDVTILLVTPNIKIKTKDSREVLPQKLKQSDWVKQLANTATLVNAFSTGDLMMLRDGLQDHYGEVFRSPLIPGFNEAKSLAMSHNALGFSISGAGPTCFAMFEDKEDAELCAKEMPDVFVDGCSTHLGSIAKQGARIL